MNSFQLSGSVLKVENATSSKGNAYLTFQVKDGQKIFEMSLFGESMQFSEMLTAGKNITIKGTLGSREYQDKNGKTRFGMNLNVSWIEPVETAAGGKSKTVAAIPVVADELDSIPF